MNAHDIIIRPIVSEKSFELMEQGRYTFEVAKDARKEQIAAAVSEVFGVTVTSVNTMNVSGKPRRLRYNKGLSRSWKKAIVTVKDGDAIDLYAGR
ncbi:MAG: 50S ribosomal protein L23 [Coriobacteriia bacterium]|jgi:large subunit ribosomal protein L23